MAAIGTRWYNPLGDRVVFRKGLSLLANCKRKEPPFP